jgi:hypothetical protein
MKFNLKIIILLFILYRLFINNNKNIENFKKNKLLFLRSHYGRDSFKCDNDEIWGPDIEAEFIKEILYNYEYISSDLDNLPSYEIDVLAYSSNIYNINDILYAIEILKPKVILHLSDENGERKEFEDLVFPKVNLVYRHYRFNNFKNPKNQKILPLGYHCWDQYYPKNSKPIFKRKYIWSFIGTSKGNRKEYLLKLDAIKPNFYGNTDRKENLEIYQNSIFVFCPVGNSNVECSRQYTASMNGCIPFLLCSDEVWDETYKHFDIIPPWLHSSNINDLINTIKYYLNNPNKLIKLQYKILKWWKDIKLTIKNNININIK